MKKGISPIVAVVLLIAIAVIAAVGLYFWVGGLATKQPTPSTPIVLGAQRVSCNATANTTTVMIQNLGSTGSVTAANLRLVDDNGTQVAGDGTDIAASNQGPIDFDNANLTSGTTYVILSTDASVSQATTVC